MCVLAVFDFHFQSQCPLICILWFLFCIYVFTSYNSQATERGLKCLVATLTLRTIHSHVPPSCVSVTPFPLRSHLSFPCKNSSPRAGRAFRYGSCSPGKPSAPGGSLYYRRKCKYRWPWKVWSKSKTRGFESAPGSRSWMGRSCKARCACSCPPFRSPRGSWRSWSPLGRPRSGAPDQTPPPWQVAPGWLRCCPGPWSCVESRRWTCRYRDPRSCRWSAG